MPSVRNGKPLLGRELTRYLAEGGQPDEAQFNLVSFWSRRGASTLEAGEEEVVHDRGMPHLALLARLYHGVEATSCQSERNLSALSFLIAHLRSSMAPFKVEQMMFLRLNQRFTFLSFASTRQSWDLKKVARTSAGERFSRCSSRLLERLSR